MKKYLFFGSLLLVSIIFIHSVFAEEKTTLETVPKLTDEEKRDGPILYNDGIYPFFGTTCSNYTYKLYYKDEKGRPPTYMRIWINGEWYDMQKINGDFSTGALYIYNYVPTSGKQLFYYFEASNGVGKTRAGIIDSPDQGPIFFSEKFDNNKIILLDKDGKLIWDYDTKNDWIESVSISRDSNKIAAVTGYYIYLFSKDSKEPFWKYCDVCEIPEVTLGNFGGVDISADGNYIAGTLQNKLYFFKTDNNKPLWSVDIGTASEGLAVSDDGNYVAVSSGETLSVLDKAGKLLWKYQTNNTGYDTNGEMYRPSITPDASYVAVSTGCPDRRAYLFSRDGQLVFKTEMLTTDSPVHKSAISNDGSLIAYSTDNMDRKEIVFLFDKTGKKLWSYSNPQDSTARAVDISKDGNYVAAGTSKGQIYLFSKNGNLLWTFSAPESFRQIGEMKFSPNGSQLAAGGSTKKVYLFTASSNKPLWEYQAVTWITKIDFNGDYIVAGTGPREYVFEGSSVGSEDVECKEIRQFAPFWLTGSEVQPSGGSTTEGSGICGNGLCEPNKGENDKNCPNDCIPGEFQENTKQENIQIVNQSNESKQTELRKCNGIVDMIKNFFSIIFGKRICN